MKTTVFNPLQIHLLQMFALDKSQQGLDEQRDVLYRHYAERMEQLVGHEDPQAVDVVAEGGCHGKHNQCGQVIGYSRILCKEGRR